MQAVILAAGCGLRLNGSTSGQPKCLVEVGGKSLLHHQLTAFQSLGISDICVVIGFEGEQIRRSAEGACHFIENTRYLQTNSLYSLLLARPWVRGDVIVANGDVLAHPEIYQRLAAAPTSALAFDSQSGQDEEHMKVSVASDGRLLEINKSIAAVSVHGESLGLFKIVAGDVPAFFADAAASLDHAGPLQWAPAAVARFALRRSVQCLDVAQWPWCEIDYQEDIDYARQHVWPRIQQLNAPAPAFAGRGTH